MSDTFTRPLAQRVGALLAGLVACAGLVAALILVTTAAPSGWWPHTADAFATSPTSHTEPAEARDADVCARIVGPAREYCLRGNAQASEPADRHVSFTALLFLVPVAALGTVAVRRRGKATR
ncbi:hypothetical protein ACWGN5_35795 [Streptomyces sp. NPDC055815]